MSAFKEYHLKRFGDKPMVLLLDEIEVRDDRRPVEPDAVSRLAQSIKRLGLHHPITTVAKNGRFELVAGRHRLEATRLLGEDRIQSYVVKASDDEARLWEISENLHRAELSKLERSELIEEWRKLTADQVRKVSAPSGGAQPKNEGIRSTARELGVDEKEVRNAATIASITPEAKEAAREAGLDYNQSALLKVASYADEDQVEAVAGIVEARSVASMRPAPARPLRNLENISGGELAAWIKATTPVNRTHTIRVLRMAADILNDELEAGKSKTAAE